MTPRWVKLPCNLRGSFAPDDACKDFECLTIYIQLLVLANWVDGEDIKRGDCVVTISTLCELCPYFGEKKVRRALERLKELGFIGINRVSKWNNAGYIVTLLHYDFNQRVLEDEWRADISTHDLNRANKRPKMGEQNANTLANKKFFNELNLKDNSEGIDEIRRTLWRTNGEQTAENGRNNTIELKHRINNNNNGEHGPLSADADRRRSWSILAEKWNDTMPHAQKIKIDILAKNTKLQKSITDAITAFGFDSVVEVMERTKISSFLSGRVMPIGDRKPFKLKIDWFCKIANYQKIAEGSYDDVAIDARRPFIE